MTAEPPPPPTAASSESSAPTETTPHRLVYRSPLLDALRARGGSVTLDGLTLRSSTRFGFCWGVDRALKLVFETIARHPKRRIWLLNQIIHNPTVNQDLVRRGVCFINGPLGQESGFEAVAAEDIVVIPAFSAQVEDLERVRGIGCEIVDTTCAWVIKPHNRTRRNIQAGFTSIIHGYVNHDETRATASLIRSEGGQHAIVANIEEAQWLCDAIIENNPAHSLARFPPEALSSGFDPTRHLEKIGLLNQTTMLARESRAIGERIRQAMTDRWGKAEIEHRFRDFDTICRATQENQDAVEEMISLGPLDVILVVGGYDSSNTHNLVRLGRRFGVPTYHIQDPATISREHLGHHCAETGREVVQTGWLPPPPHCVGFTAGASTPDTLLAETIERVVAAAGIERHRLADALGTAHRGSEHQTSPTISARSRR